VTHPNSCVIQVFKLLPGNERGVRCLARGVGRGATQHYTAELGSARRKHRFVYCCVVAGTCFEVTVLAWRKYAIICSEKDRFEKYRYNQQITALK
jgi:hypothetical protein